MEWLYYLFLMILSSIIYNEDLSLAAQFDVTRFGAVGNGYHDDSQAFLSAWNEACRSNVASIIVVPHGKTYLLSPVQFIGPCKAPHIDIQIDGNLVGHNDPSEWRGCVENVWILFSNVDNIEVHGTGKLDGKGLPWWKNIKKSLNQIKSTCLRPPGLLKFKRCNNVGLSGLTLIDPPNNNIRIQSCNNLRMSHLRVLSPKKSPNTDGIDIGSSTNIYLTNSYISPGDDCVAVTSGSSNILVEAVTCKNGHGISVGSLGHGGSYATVENVIVRNCTFIETTNGARIKTYQGGRGYAKNITYDHIKLVNVQNPIIITQNYFCKQDHDCSEQQNAVQLSDIKFKNIRGTSATMEAIHIQCNKYVPCNNIILEKVHIWKSAAIKQVYALCKYAHVRSTLGTYPKLFCSW